MTKPFSGNFPLTQGFGLNLRDYAQFGMKGHNGEDYALPGNTPLIAAISGEVVETGNHPAGYGLYIKIENDIEGVITAHMQSFSVNQRQKVTEGQLIGYSDNTGYSTGNHLHFGYFRKPRNRQNGYDGWIDPKPFYTTGSTQLPVPSQPSMTDNERKNNVQMARATIELKKAGLIPTDATEYWHDNPADENKFTNFIKRLIRDSQNPQVDVAKIKEEGRQVGMKQVKDAANKVI